MFPIFIKTKFKFSVDTFSLDIDHRISPLRDAIWESKIYLFEQINFDF